MTQAAQAILEAFEHLSYREREDVIRELLLRAAGSDYEGFTDDELLAAGRILFADLDRREAEA